MGRKRKSRKEFSVAGQVRGIGFSLLFMAGVFWLLPAFMGNGAVSRTMAQSLRKPVPYVLLLGIALLVVAFLLKRRDDASMPELPRAEPKWTPGVFTPPPVEERPWVPQEVADPKRKEPSREWGPQVFADIEWRRFEAVCEALFAQAGFEAKTQSHGADGGVDIWLYSRNASGPAAVVQCKHWSGRRVGVKELREFYGVMASKGMKRGTYATSSTYTEDASVFAKSNGISALDGSGLLALIGKRTPEQQQQLLRVAYEGEYWRPTCASCGIKLAAKTQKASGDRFWGCTNYPRCRTTMPMRS